MTEQLDGQMTWFDQTGSYGKMCREYFQAEHQEARISELSSKRSPKSATPMLLFLDLRNGRKPDVSWEMAGASHGELLMLNFSEHPNEENGSHLSDVLEDTTHPRFCLSKKACEGILRRAANRGKELPKELKDALERQANGE